MRTGGRGTNFSFKPRKGLIFNSVIKVIINVRSLIQTHFLQHSHLFFQTLPENCASFGLFLYIRNSHAPELLCVGAPVSRVPVQRVQVHLHLGTLGKVVATHRHALGGRHHPGMGEDKEVKGGIVGQGLVLTTLVAVEKKRKRVEKLLTWVDAESKTGFQLPKSIFGHLMCYTPCQNEASVTNELLVLKTDQ